MRSNNMGIYITSQDLHVGSGISYNVLRIKEVAEGNLGEA